MVLAYLDSSLAEYFSSGLDMEAVFPYLGDDQVRYLITKFTIK